MLEATKQEIEALKANTGITDINFAGKELGDEGATLLAQALTGRQLTSLNLRDTKITTAGFQPLLVVIEACANLKKLDLGGLTLDWSSLIFAGNSYSRALQMEINKTLIANALADKQKIIDQQQAKITELEGKINTNKIIQDQQQAKIGELEGKINANKTNQDQQQVKIGELEGKINANKTIQDQQQAKIGELEGKINANKTNQDKQQEEIDELKGKIKANKTIQRQQQVEFVELEGKVNDQKSRIDQHAGIIGESQKVDAQRLEVLTSLKEMSNRQMQQIDELESKFSQHVKDSIEKILDFHDKLKVLEEKWVEVSDSLEKTKKLIKSASQFINELLITATKSGNFNLANTALEIGADLKAIDPLTGETPLMLALNGGYKEIAKLFSNTDPEVITYPNQHGQTPMEETVKDADDSRTYWLWKLACNKKREDRVVKFSAHELFKCIETKNYEHFCETLKLAQSILQNSARENVHEKKNDDANDDKTIPAFNKLFLEKNFKDQTVLHLAANVPPMIVDAAEKIDTVEQKDSSADFLIHLLDKLPDLSLLETQNTEGKTALHLAVEAKNEKIVELLLEKKANIVARDNEGQIPLHKAVAAAGTGNEVATNVMKIIKLLVNEHAQNKTKVFQKDNNKKTPPDIATDNKNEKLAQRLPVWYGSAKTLVSTIFRPSFSSCSPNMRSSSSVPESTNTSSSSESTEDVMRSPFNTKLN